MSFISNHTIEVNQSTISNSLIKPNNISDDIWALRGALLKQMEKSTLDSFVNDCIASGVDTEALLNFIDELNKGKYRDPVGRAPVRTKSFKAISVFGKIIPLPFSPKTFNIFPSEFSLKSAIFASIFAFISSVLVILLSDEFLSREKWWIGIICGFSFYSILQWPSTDPYTTSVPDCWNSSTRCFTISLICALWKGALKIRTLIPTLVIPFSYWTIDCNLLSSYVCTLCRIGLLFMPFWIIFGFLGHPVTVIVSFVESFNRYVFGQNGVSGISHMIVQFLRGAVTVLLSYFVLTHFNTRFNLAIAIAIATFLSNLAGFKIKRPLLLSVVSFISSILTISLFHNAWGFTKWIELIWFVTVEILIPILSCCHKYFFLHINFIPKLEIEPLLRSISSFVIASMFITSCLCDYQINTICLAFIITHAIHKSQSESHVFAFAVILSVITFPYEFGLKNNVNNLALSLLIVAKLETFLPMLDLTYHSRDPTDLDDEMDGVSALILNILYSLIQSFHFIDFLFKMPTLIWSFFTGSSGLAFSGVSYLLCPSSPRPFYFFNWPVERKDLRTLLTRGASEHPIETPVYLSVCSTLRKNFATMCKRGELGLVNAGDIFLFKSNELSAFVHVIAIEPNCYKIQFRGLEYNSQTSCHRGEARRLNELINSYLLFPNFQAAKVATHFVVDIRAMDIPLPMYDITKTNLSRGALVGASQKTLKLSFLYSLCYMITKHKENISREVINNEITDQIFLQHMNNLITFSNSYINKIFQYFSFPYVEEELELYKVLWGIISTHLFNVNGSLNYSNLTSSFKNELHLNLRDEFSWVNNSTKVLKLIKKIIRFGVGLSYMASSGMFDSDSDNKEICEYIKEFDDDYVVTTMDSKLFYNTFIECKKKIITIEKIKDIYYIMRFSFCVKKWNVYQMKHEWIRAIWNNETTGLLFYKIRASERMSIQHNSRFFNNTIVQSCDFPVGYPAYVSEIMDSFT